MDENTRFIIRRIDAVESRLLKKIEDLQAFRNRLIGITIFLSFGVPLVMEFLFKGGR